ncbi:MAG: VOC family protein [Burkholderiales bacterium]|nr:VOC family protein [Burkholderiales bacterium]
MYDHIGLKVKDLDVAVRFYEAALSALGHVVGSREGSYAGIGPKDEPGLWLYRAQGATGPGVHVAFRAKDRAAVDLFHRSGLAAGGKDNGEPGLRADYSPTYYAAFLIDPDGNNVEAVCMAAK